MTVVVRVLINNTCSNLVFLPQQQKILKYEWRFLGSLSPRYIICLLRMFICSFSVVLQMKLLCYFKPDKTNVMLWLVFMIMCIYCSESKQQQVATDLLQPVYWCCPNIQNESHSTCCKVCGFFNISLIFNNIMVYLLDHQIGM